ncbi:MAG: hypothetical protein JW969_01305 [Spirochaetales bacterium]|nr:hypothetical protein [Spirochaetales bacterium]
MDKKLKFSQDDIFTIGKKLLALNPGPIPKYRILRDVLNYDADGPERTAVKEKLGDTKWVSILYKTQLKYGTWGRFHTRDSSVKKIIPTTELAIQTALDSGLDKQIELLKKTVSFIIRHLEGKTTWSDTPEKHDNPAAWPVSIRHLSAANLALIDPYHGHLDYFWNYWVEVTEKAFKTGEYNRNAEIRIRNKLDLESKRTGRPPGSGSRGLQETIHLFPLV